MSIEYSIAAGPTKFAIGTEGGMIYSCNRRGKTPEDRIGTIYHGAHPVLRHACKFPLLADEMILRGQPDMLWVWCIAPLLKLLYLGSIAALSTANRMANDLHHSLRQDTTARCAA